MFLYKSLNINTLKRQLYFPRNTYVFLEKVVHVFRETRTTFYRIIRQGTRTYRKIYDKSPFFRGPKSISPKIPYSNPHCGFREP